MALPLSSLLMLLLVVNLSLLCCRVVTIAVVSIWLLMSLLGPININNKQNQQHFQNSNNNSASNWQLATILLIVEVIEVLLGMLDILPNMLLPALMLDDAMLVADCCYEILYVTERVGILQTVVTVSCWIDHCSNSLSKFPWGWKQILASMARCFGALLLLLLWLFVLS